MQEILKTTLNLQKVHPNFLYGVTGDLQNHLNSVNKLIDIFGPNCVTSAKLSFTCMVNGVVKSADEMIELLELLDKISAGIECLDLEIGFENVVGFENILNKKTEELLLSFPNIKKLSLLLLRIPDRMAPSFFKFVIKYFSQVTQFEYQSSRPCPFLTEFQRLNVLRIDNFSTLPPQLPASLENIRQLDILAIGRDMWPSLINLINLCSSTLLTLQIVFSKINLPAEPIFPKLRCLQLLSILPHVVYYNCRPVVLNPRVWNINPSTFPMLESLDIPVGWSFNGDHLTKKFPPLPGIRRTLRDDNHRTEKNSRLNIKEYVQHIQTQFPNVSSLEIASRCDWSISCTENLLKELIQSSEMAKNLRELTIGSHFEDPLGRVLGGIVENSGVAVGLNGQNQIMTNIRKLKFVVPEDHYFLRGHYDVIPRKEIVNLLKLATYFPRLRRIEIPTLLPANNTKERAKKLKEISNKCPKRTIELTDSILSIQSSPPRPSTRITRNWNVYILNAIYFLCCINY